MKNLTFCAEWIDYMEAYRVFGRAPLIRQLRMNRILVIFENMLTLLDYRSK